MAVRTTCSPTAAARDPRQIQYKTLPLWLIYAYYFEWVGLGGRGMGGAYTFAHKEGHHRNGGIYRPWIANTIGNFWENWMGFWFVHLAPRAHTLPPVPPPFLVAWTRMDHFSR
jgi:hypothetical protein